MSGRIRGEPPCPSSPRASLAPPVPPGWRTTGELAAPGCQAGRAMSRPLIRIREVGPRDGFQNEPEIVPTDEKVRLINSLGRARLQRIEVASFVRPDVLHQPA